MVSPRLGPGDDGWPRLVVRRERGSDPHPKPPGTVEGDDDGVTIWLLDGGRLDLRREPLELRVLTPEPVTDDAILHPYLGLPAAIVAWWQGRHALHGGAFASAGGGWAVLGDKEGGKSSTLAGLLLRGHEVLTDDILILEGTTLFSGPRAVDLRGEAAALLGGEELGLGGSRERFRLETGPAPPSAPLRGIVHLAWGEDLSLTALDPAARLQGLVDHSVLPPQADGALRLLDLAAVPAWRFERPRRIGALDECLDYLLAGLPD